MYCLSDASFLQVISRIFPPGFFFLSKELTKIRKFYEFILVDTDSIYLTHQYDDIDKTKIKFSKFKIIKVWSPSDWGQPPTKGHSFSRIYSPHTFNYFDYMDAWTNLLAIEPFNHN